VSSTPPGSIEGGAAPRYVFVVTYGRSGSTLTQGMLNALPRTLVRGENNLYLLPLYRAYARLERFAGKFGGPGAAQASSAFYGLRELVQHQLLGGVPAADVDRLGFKEVLWYTIKRKEWSGFFGFMDAAFDKPQYVLNRRDVAMASTSGFWRKREPGVAERQINRVRRLQDFLRESRPDRCFDTEFEAITSDDRDVAADQLRRLAEFVTGGCDEGLLERLLATRDTGHGPNPFGKARDADRA
jgi:hypothetical protein